MDKTTVDSYKKMLTGKDRDDKELLKKIGELYYKGDNNVEKDFSEAVQYLKRAAGFGDSEAAFFLANCYYEGGHGIRPDADLAFQYCRASANKGNKEAMKLLSFFYSEGVGTPKDIKAAKNWNDRGGGGDGSDKEKSETLVKDENSVENNSPKQNESYTAKNTKEAKRPSENKGLTQEPDIDGSGGVEPVAKGSKSKLPIVIISGAVLAGLVTFLIVFLNISSQNSVIIVDSNGNTIEAANNKKDEENSDSDDAEKKDKKHPEKIEIQPVFERSAMAEPAEILYDSGNITREGQVDTFDYTTPRDGRYRIEIADMPGSMRVDVGFYDPAGEAIGEETGCKNGQGVTVKYLKPDTTYKITVKQNTGIGSYRVVVGVQKPTPDITELTRIDDSVEYTDQRNLYNFVVPRDGCYRFELSGLKSGADTDMLIFNDPGDKISENLGCGNGDGITLADVKKGDIYEIQVRQKNGYSDYSLNIGQQKGTVNITDNSIITDSLEYIGQRNIYSFNAGSSGNVTFTLSGMSSGMAVKFIVMDENGNVLTENSNCRNNTEVSISDVNLGTHYFIHVEECSSGTGGYTLNVE